MAKENGQLTAAEKGKGKMEEDKPADEEKRSEELKKDKDGKPIMNGKKGDEPQEGICLWPTKLIEADQCPVLTEELSEEDQQLKSELEMLVERLKAGQAFDRGSSHMLTT